MTTLLDEAGVRVYLEEIRPEGDVSAREAERATVRLIINKVFGAEAELAHRADGSPWLPGHPEVRISISHCRTAACVAITENSAGIGVDIETTDRGGQLRRIMTRFLTPEEIANGWDGHLLEAWTLKEAAYKAATAPSADLRCISLPPAPPVRGQTIISGAERLTILSIKVLFNLSVSTVIKSMP